MIDAIKEDRGAADVTQADYRDSDHFRHDVFYWEVGCWGTARRSEHLISLTRGKETI